MNAPVSITRQPVVALVGNPNAGKTSLFNALTGSRQKVGNYPGVTVERKAGRLALPDGRSAELIDLPGTYSLTPRSPDEAVTRDAIFGRIAGERPLDAIVAVVDATNLRNHLRFVLELKALGLPLVVALNMIDLAARDGIGIDSARLGALLDLPVVETVAVRRRGLEALGAALAARIGDTPPALPQERPSDVRALQKQARTLSVAVQTSTGSGSPPNGARCRISTSTPSSKPSSHRRCAVPGSSPARSMAAINATSPTASASIGR